jgi:hypothetical protein
MRHRIDDDRSNIPTTFLFQLEIICRLTDWRFSCGAARALRRELRVEDLGWPLSCGHA